MFKKIALSIFVIAVFVFYSIHQRNESNASMQRLTTNKNQENNSSTTIIAPTPSSPSSTSTSTYKDGSYTGDAADAFYGNIQVKATIANGKISDVIFLQYPNDRRNSVMINDYAMPILKQQAIQAQSAHVDGVSGATDSSQAFIESLGSALDKAKS